jgi:hypothetical protein
MERLKEPTTWVFVLVALGTFVALTYGGEHLWRWMLAIAGTMFGLGLGIDSVIHHTTVKARLSRRVLGMVEAYPSGSFTPESAA